MPDISKRVGSKTLSQINNVNWQCHKFQGFQSKPQDNSTVSSRDNNRASVSLSQSRLCLLSPTPTNHFNVKPSLNDSNLLIKSVPDKKPWLCQLWGHLPYWKTLKLQELFFSVRIRRGCASQSHVTEAHPKPTKIQFVQKQAHEKESHVLFLEWLFKLAHAADQKWRVYLFRED